MLRVRTGWGAGLRVRPVKMTMPLRRYASDDHGKLPMDAYETNGPLDPYQAVHMKHLDVRPIPPDWDDRDIGDYPNVPVVSDQLRPRYPERPYDDPQMRRYANELVAEQSDAYSMWYYDEEPNVTFGAIMRAFILFWGGLFVFTRVVDYFDDPYERHRTIPRRIYVSDPLIKRYEGMRTNVSWAPEGYEKHRLPIPSETEADYVAAVKAAAK